MCRCSRFSERDPYTKLAQTISINIIDFDLFEFEKYHSTFWLTEEYERIRLTDIVRVDFLELQKARNITGQSDDMKQLWMDFLNAESEEELLMLAQKNEVFQRPMTEVVRLSSDASVREQHFKRQMAIMDRIAEIEYGTEQGLKRGREEGRVEGREEGRREGLLQAARKLKAIGTSPAVIAEATGITLEEIEKL